MLINNCPLFIRNQYYLAKSDDKPRDFLLMMQKKANDADGSKILLASRFILVYNIIE